MNTVFRVIWNETKRLWQCVSELTATCGKRSHSKAIKTSATSLPLSSLFLRSALVSAILGSLMVPMTSMAANPFENGKDDYQSPGVLDFGRDFSSNGFPWFAVFWTKNAPVVNPQGSGTWSIDAFVGTTIASDTTDLVNDAPTWWNDFFEKIGRSPESPGEDLYYGTVTDSFDAAANLPVWGKFAGLMVYTGEVLVSGNMEKPIHLNSDTTLRFTGAGTIILGNPTPIMDRSQYQPPTVIAPTDFSATVRVVPNDGARGEVLRWDINRGAQLSVEVLDGRQRANDIFRTDVSNLAEFPWLNNIEDIEATATNAPFREVTLENTSAFAMDLTAMAEKSIYEWNVAANATIEGDNTFRTEIPPFLYATINVLDGVELSTRGPATITNLNLKGSLTVNHPTTVKALTVAGSSAVSVAANQTLTVPQILFKDTDIGTLTLAQGAQLVGHDTDPIGVTFEAMPPMSSNNPWMAALQNYTYGLNLTIKGDEKGDESVLSNVWLNASKRLTLEDGTFTTEANATLICQNMFKH